MTPTTFTCIGIGYALSNREMKSKEIEVFLPEQSNMRDGELIPGTADLSYDLSDINAMTVSGKITTSNTITALWLPMSSWVAMPPSIRRGERVLVYRMADTDVFYWKELGLDDGLRRRDTIIIALSNTQDESTKYLTFENSYWLEFSTLTKKIALVTNKSDGEPFAYQVYIDTKEGRVVKQDDIGNFTEMVSAENRHQFVTADGTYLRIEKNFIDGLTSEGAQLFMDGPNVTMLNAEGCTYTLIDGDVTTTTPGGSSITMNSDIVFNNGGGCSIEMVGGNITITNGAGAVVDLTGPIAKVEAGGGVVEVGAGMVKSN